MRFVQDCYRALDPRWSFSPLSGDGAAKQGGRFNANGTPALYLSTEIETAIVEASQAFTTKFEPLTICLYSVDCEDVVDLRSEAERNRMGIEWNHLACAWMLERDSGVVPKSWQVVGRLQQDGIAGILVPSFAVRAKADAANLVLWRWGPVLPHRVVPHDPNDRLPVDRSSWSGRA